MKKEGCGKSDETRVKVKKIKITDTNVNRCFQYMRRGSKNVPRILTSTPLRSITCSCCTLRSEPYVCLLRNLAINPEAYVTCPVNRNNYSNQIIMARCLWLHYHIITAELNTLYGFRSLVSMFFSFLWAERFHYQQKNVVRVYC